MKVTARLLLKAAGTQVNVTLTRRSPSKRLAEEVDKFSQYTPTTLTLENFVKFGSTKSKASGVNSFQFLSKELPVRFANIMKEFKLLPEQLYCTPSVQVVEDWYTQSFSEIIEFKDGNPQNEGILNSFNEVLAAMLIRHSKVVETMAQGLLEMKESEGGNKNEGRLDNDRRQIQRSIQYFLDRFYLNRISVRMLINQHMHMFTDVKSDGSYIGSIDQNCDVQSIAEDAYNDARFLCEQCYMVAPECEFECRNPYEKKEADGQIAMTYVPTHLHHMLFEILKNSMRAVVEYNEGKTYLPKIKVLICKGRTDITIKVSDQGGGIRRSEIESLFSYTYSTAPRPELQHGTPLAGYGYGLPLSHLYARYFNGDLWLNSVDGYGTDAMLCLKLFPCDASELLPIYNKTSLQKYTQPAIISDWSDPLHNREISSKRSPVGGR